MSETSHCPDCGAALPESQPKGLCPQCALQGALEVGADKDSISASPVLSLPQAFGDYELLEEIARGGMGIVFKARQRSLDRIVAVKLILAGQFASREQALRFRVEAEAAARLQHPNIVRIHETGEQDGQPYFSMDYVEGGNLAQTVRKNPIPATRAAGYVKTIAEAIHYAHDQGILHRDLKPSNVLIDPAGEPRVTDFGLAKRMTKDSFLTVTGEVMGSPSFMPPEQAGAKGIKAGRYSDVYGLGAILFYLVTGRAPFVARNMGETLDHILNIEPASPCLFNPGLPPDLATICLKCLEKDPRRRYQTAQQLADELGRFLKGEPILARPTPRADRIWRWCKRRPALASLILTVLILLVAGTGLGVWLTVQAKRAERNATAEATGSDQIAIFLTSMLSGIRPSIARGRDVAVFREMMSNAVLRLHAEELKGQPRARVSLLNALGAAYGELSEYDKAVSMFREGLAIEESIHGRFHPHVARSLTSIAKCELARGDFSQAEALFREALRVEKAGGAASNSDIELTLATVLAQHGSLTNAESLARTVLNREIKQWGVEDHRNANAFETLGFVLLRQERFTEAETNLVSSLLLRERGTNSESETAGTLTLLALVLTQQGKLDQAEPMFPRVLEQRERLHGEESLEVAATLNSFGIFLWSKGKMNESLDLLLRSLTIREKFMGTNHPLVATTLYNLGAVYLLLQKPSDAERLLLRALAIQELRLGPDHPDIAETMQGLGYALAQQKRLGPAEDYFRRAMAMRRRLFGEDDEKAINLGYSLGKALLEQERWDDAELVARDLLRVHRNHSLPNSDSVVTLNNLALVIARKGNLAEARRLLDRAFAEQKRLPANQRTNMLEPGQAFVQLLVGINKVNEAEQAFDDFAANQQTATGKPDEETINAYARFAAALEQANRFTNAAGRYRTALALSEKLHGVEHDTTAQLSFNLGVLLAGMGTVPEAIARYQAALSFWDKTLAHDPRLFQSLMRLGELLCKQGRLAESKQCFARGLEMARKQHGVPHAQVAQSLFRVGNAFSDRGANVEAEPFLREAYEMRRELFGDNSLLVADSLGCLGHLKGDEQPKQSAMFFRQEVAVRDKLAPGELDTANAHRNLAWALSRAGRTAEAKAEMERALSLGRKVWTNAPIVLAHTITCVAIYLGDEKKHDQAEALMLEAVGITRTNLQATVAGKRAQIEVIWKFYVDWAVGTPGSGKMQQALEWRKKLTEFDQASRPRKPGAK